MTDKHLRIKIITFDPDKPIECPECKATENYDDENMLFNWWMDNDGIFHFECFDCNHEWLGKAIRENEKKKKKKKDLT